MSWRLDDPSIKVAGEMSVPVVQSKIKAEGIADVQAATKKALAALGATHPDGLRYASCLLPDGETFVLALLRIDDGGRNPLPGLPECKELLEIVEGSRAEPPIVEQLTVNGSYPLF